MKNVTFLDRFRYHFDNIMSKGAIALIGWLFALSAAAIVVISLLVQITGIAPMAEDGRRPGFLELIWTNLMRAMDAGYLGGDIGGWPFLLVMLLMTMVGLFVVSILIGILTSGIESKLDELRKGRSRIIEQDHTIILGWSPQVVPILSELIIANANRPRSCIALLADKDKVEMEDEIREKVGSTGRTRVVCRTGSPIDLTDLDIVNPNNARAIVILAPPVARPDPHVIKTILALTNGPNRRPEPYHIVAELHNPKSVEVAHLAGAGEIETVLTSDLISRITVQTCRQSGLSVVYTELLDFGGDEIYFQEEPELVGRTFGEALLAYEDSAVLGRQSRAGQVQLNPPMDTRMEEGDRIIAISRDDDTIRLARRTNLELEVEAIREQEDEPPAPERTLILGWNKRAPTIIRELDRYVAPGSELLVVAGIEEEELSVTACPAEISNQSLSFRQGDTTDRQVLETLAISTYHHVIVLSYSDQFEPQEADAQTLVTLLHLRRIAEQSGNTFSIVSEMLDVRNRDLAEITRADDFIVSDKLVSLLLTQIAENKQLAAVFADLFDPEGVELYLKPAGRYVQPGRPLNFYTVVEAARRRGEVAVGYRRAGCAGDADQGYGVKLNPPKSERITFTEDDRIIVLAEE